MSRYLFDVEIIPLHDSPSVSKVHAAILALPEVVEVSSYWGDRGWETAVLINDQFTGATEVRDKIHTLIADHGFTSGDTGGCGVPDDHRLAGTEDPS